MNKNGLRTVDARVRLADELQTVLAEGPLVEHGADPDQWQVVVDGIGGDVDAGEGFEAFWAACMHGEDLPPPSEALVVKQTWAEWLARAKRVATQLADSRRQADRLGRAGLE